ncbi:MAG: hypothetical protein AUK35_00180 [Zetaproteobacteria bacterium CG2_30_46_52]|nr:MAG: hypothetical protein AUK35_00180 [Zetaproteobacteria bacterium CG2_30_46_52]
MQTQDMLRQVQYRLARQGMIELDFWLSPLILALKDNNADVLQAANLLLALEAPVLLDMQLGKIDIPKELQPWLKA